MMDYQFRKIAKLGFPAVTLPAFDYRRATVVKRMIRRGFCFGLPLEKIFTLSFPVRQGNGFAAALPASEALSRRSVAGSATRPGSRDARRSAPSGKSARVADLLAA